MGWCEEVGGGHPWGIALCKVHSVAGPLLLLVALAHAFTALQRSGLGEKRKQPYGLQVQARALPGSLTLLLAHLGAAAYTYATLKEWSSNLLHDISMALFWGIIAGVLCGARPEGAKAQLGGGLLVPVAATYGLIAVLTVRLYWAEATPAVGVHVLKAGVGFLVTSRQLDPRRILLSKFFAQKGDVEEAGKAPRMGRKWRGMVAACLGYLWPRAKPMQARALGSLLVLTCQRLLTLATPVLFKHAIDVLSDVTAKNNSSSTGETSRGFPFWQVFYPWPLAYLAVTFLNGGVTAQLRSYLWVPVVQQAYKRVKLDIFAHTLALDLSFHLQKRTGEVTQIIARGSRSMHGFFTMMVFSIFPNVFDIVAASVYLAIALKPWIAVIILATLLSYIPLTIWLIKGRAKYRRDLNVTENAESAKATDVLMNFEVVKTFQNEALERASLAGAIENFQRVEFTLLESLTVLNVSQSLILFSGLASGFAVCVQGVADGTSSVGDVVLFITLVQQLYSPLSNAGTYYRGIQQALIDMENMFDLFATTPQIQDKPFAQELRKGRPLAAASLEFDDVSFGYQNSKPVLRNISFSVQAGETLALVGATGSGKSTVLRLLFRFYDPQSGTILVSGAPIADVSMASLRRLMAVVPQDTALFNESLLYNIRYGRPSASEADVQEAAKAASIHEDILAKFPQGYSTVVGERGLRLSGGEKQRVAFARSMLKDPAILLLDEATSALDSITEKKIQDRLKSMRRHRTTIIVAHRLSTIMDADKIAVLHEGAFVEFGSHAELLQRGGLYAEMWARQQDVRT